MNLFCEVSRIVRNEHDAERRTIEDWNIEK